MRKLRRLPTYLFAFLILAVATAAHAQELCETIKTEAFDAMKANCEGVEGEVACYGFDSLIATFNDSVDPQTFTNPSDLVDLLELNTVQTQPFDEEERQWGIGYFRIPIAGSDEPLVIMMAGDVIVENAVEADDDGLSPMQAFNFETAGQSDCRFAPNAIFIQAPQDMEVDLRVNSTPIRIGSTIVLGTEPDDAGDQSMWFGVLEGHLTTNPDTPEEQTVPEGNVTTVEMTAPESGDLVPVIDPATGEPIIGPNGEPFYRRAPASDFTEPEPITVDGEGFLGWSSYTFVSDIPQELIPYAIAVGDECVLKPRSDLDELWAHVGPGRNRSVRTILALDATYSPTQESTTDNGEVWYEIQTDLGPLWVSGGDFESDCASQIGVQVERAPACALVPREGLAELWAHVGPGRNRSVRTILDLDATYIPINQQDVDGVTWYQVTTENFGNLWISGEDLANSCGVAESGEIVAEPVNNEPSQPTVTRDPSLPTFTPSPSPDPAFANPVVTEEAVFPTEEVTFPTEEVAAPTEEIVPPTDEPAPPPDMTCMVEVAPGQFERTYASVLYGASEGNYVWETSSRLVNNYSYWLVWEDGVWYTGFYGDCSPLGYGDPAPAGISTIN